jgi:quercetin dioxygenase-like cupin family protein
MKYLPSKLFFMAMLFYTFSCKKHHRPAPLSDLAVVTTFSKVDKGSPEKYHGATWHQGFVDPDSIYNLVAGNTNYELGARSNWHTHPSGIIIIVIDGKGYHQIKGEPKRLISKGQVIKCPPDVPHWDGATEDTELSLIYIIPDADKGIVNWLEPVTDHEYFVE